MRFLQGVLLGLLPVLAPPAEALPQQDGNDLDVDFSFRVEKAIDQGMKFLEGQHIKKYWFDAHPKDGDELILFTYLHAGTPEDRARPYFQELLKNAIEEDLERCYQVSLIAMCMEEYHRVNYQWRLYQCGQYLVDNLDGSGGGGYGAPVDLPTIRPPKQTATKKATGKETPREKPKVVRRIPVKQRSKYGKIHDLSNMQYIALGLRACHDGGIVFEPALIKRFRDWIKSCQKEKGPKGVLELEFPAAKAVRGRTQTRPVMRVAAAPRGWGYRRNDPKAYGSMTVGAVGALCITSYILGEDWRRDQDVLDGMMWIATNFSVTRNPKAEKQNWYFYYMYGLERAGILFGVEGIGGHRWYREGAEELLKKQKANGAWDNPTDTCFALLFLKRATQGLESVETLRRR